MNKSTLQKEVITALEKIHDNVFIDIDVNKVMEKDEILDNVLDKYTKYFNYTDNKQAYNVNYCFKTAIADLEIFYTEQEKKLSKITKESKIYTLDHNLNEHIYEEVLECQKRVKNFHKYTLVLSFLLTFGLIFVLTEIAHLFETHNFVEITILAFVITISKIVIDKMYLNRLVAKIAWRYFKKSIRRSLAFYFTSDIVLEYLSSNEMSNISEEQLNKFKTQVKESIDIILHEVI